MRRAAGLVIIAGLVGSLTNGVQAAGYPSTLELRVITYGSLSPADVDLARETATDLLATAGLRVLWRECLAEACTEPSDSRRVVLVHLLPIAKRSDVTISGEVARGPTNNPIVLVYVPRNVDITQAIRRSRAGRSHPALATLAPGHLVGLTIAHEVGHTLGLDHSSKGPMKAQPDPEDVIAMRQSLLRFPRMPLQDRALAKTSASPASANRWRF